MDSARGRAITAIGDVRIESFVASSLERQGWEVIYRALSYNGLNEFINNLEEKEVMIILGVDFERQIDIAMKLGNESTVKIPLTDTPKSDYELSELIRSHSQKEQEIWACLPPIPIIALTSFGRRAGTSTIAINIAHELALLGGRPLLIDAHSRSPFLADQLGLFGINRNPVKIEQGITLFEATSREDFCKVEESISQFDYVLLDIGETFQPSRAIVGFRQDDYLLQWAVHHAQQLIVVSQAGAIKEQVLIDKFRELERVALRRNISSFITLNAMASKRDRERQKGDFERSVGVDCRLFSRDDRAVAKTVNLQTTLANAAPKSLFREEISQYALEVKRRGA